MIIRPKFVFYEKSGCDFSLDFSGNIILNNSCNLLRNKKYHLNLTIEEIDILNIDLDKYTKLKINMRSTYIFCIWENKFIIYPELKSSVKILSKYYGVSSVEDYIIKRIIE